MSAYGNVAVLHTVTAIIPTVQAGWDDSALIVNNGPAVIYIGDDNSVATTTGIPVQPGQALTFKHGSKGVWGIAAADQVSPLDTRFIVEVTGT